MTLRLVGSDAPSAAPPGARALAPGAPLSPGTLPLEYAHHLQFGEALVWWGRKRGWDAGPILTVAGLLAAVLAVVSILVPEFWHQPWRLLWRPLAALASPLVLVGVRERLNQRAVLVTDTAVIDIPRNAPAERLGFGNIRRVRRDLLHGGIRLEGAVHRVRIPPALVGDARLAIASQRHAVLGTGGTRPDDPQRWLP